MPLFTYVPDWTALSYLLYQGFLPRAEHRHRVFLFSPKMSFSDHEAEFSIDDHSCELTTLSLDISYINVVGGRCETSPKLYCGRAR
jgi:hypothetical protein